MVSEVVIEMFLCFKCDFVVFQYLFNQIDVFVWFVQFIVQKLIGWVGCGIKFVVNIGVQDVVGFQCVCVLLYFFS